MIGTYLMNTLPCNSPNNHIRKSAGRQETYLVLQNIAFAYKQQLRWYHEYTIVSCGSQHGMFTHTQLHAPSKS